MHAFVHKPDLPTLLLIDDDMVSREVMATVLTMTGYLMHTAASGAASLELLDGGGCAPAVILMDAQMPGLNGVPLIKELRARTKARVVAISASRASDEVLAASDGFLLKPFGAEAIRRILEGGPHQADATEPMDSEPGMDTDAPVVNPETLAQLREMMPETAVKEIYTAIVSDLYKRIEALEAAIAKDDDTEVRRIGHSIKGGCGMAGAMQAARLGALLQAGALEQDHTGRNQLDNSNAMLSELRAAAHNLESMLNQEFPG